MAPVPAIPSTRPLTSEVAFPQSASPPPGISIGLRLIRSVCTSIVMKRFTDTCLIEEPLQGKAQGVNAEIELLLCCARSEIDSNTLESIRTLLSQRLDWPCVIQSAKIHGVLPL